MNTNPLHPINQQRTTKEQPPHGGKEGANTFSDPPSSQHKAIENNYVLHLLIPCTSHTNQTDDKLDLNN